MQFYGNEFENPEQLNDLLTKYITIADLLHGPRHSFSDWDWDIEIWPKEWEYKW
jgi:hypothetical protein